MIRIRPGIERGHFRNDWLDARFSFSFGAYRDPRHDAWSDLLVLNEDRVAPGAGFALHAHRDIEAISYPLAGEIEHRDSLGATWRLRPGDVQRMSAGSGISHSEMNASATEPEHHLQFWIRPAVPGIAPGSEQRHFDAASRHGRLRLIVSPDGQGGSLRVHQDARIHAGLLGAEPVHHAPAPGRRGYLHVALGSVLLGERRLLAGDGAFIEDELLLTLRGAPAGDVLLFDLR